MELKSRNIQHACNLFDSTVTLLSCVDRSRSVFERALDVDPRSIQLWLSYTEMELKSRNIQHAHNLFDRAVTLLSHVDRSRSVFERALDVDPRSIQLWLSYTEMELKSRNIQHARNLFDRAVTLLSRVDRSRSVFERALDVDPRSIQLMAGIYQIGGTV